MFYRQILGAILLVFSFGACGKQKEINEENTSKFKPSSVFVSQSQEDKDSHKKMLDALSIIKLSTNDKNKYLGDLRARQVRGLLYQTKSELSKEKKWFYNRILGWSELNLGNEEEGIKHLKNAYDLLPEVKEEIEEKRVFENIFMLGVAWMRRGETQNCCSQYTPDSCIIPISESAVHLNEKGSRNAIQYFSELLAKAAEKSVWYYRSKWLLNVAYMTLGEYPEKVPQKYLIPESAFRSEETYPVFKNIANDLGLDSFNLSGGVVIDDFNNDNRLDIVTTSWSSGASPKFFMRLDDGSFKESSIASGLEGVYGGLNIESGDYNNDGNLDLYILRGAWLEGAGDLPNSLLRNNGDGTFTDVTFKLGLADVNRPTQTAGWSDFDNDGDLDLFVGNETTPGKVAPCQLFRNDGENGFIDIAISAGVTNDRFTKGVSWGDYNNDRFPDLYVSNFRGKNRLYKNNGDGTFTDVAEKLGVGDPISSFPAWFWDFDNDGQLDIFVASYSGNIEHLAAYKSNEPAEYERLCLYKNDGKGGFTEVAEKVGLKDPVLPMGSNFGDINNDGYLDFYLGTGDPGYGSLMPNLMYLNKSGEYFADITMASRLGHLQKGHAVAFADLDNDGDVDLFEQLGGAYPGDGYRDALFENPGSNNSSITVKIIGEKSNKSGIGVRIRIDITENGVKRSVYRHVNSGGSFGANPLRQCIGTGGAQLVDSMEIFWPTTNRTQVFKNFKTGTFVEVLEGSDQLNFLGE